MYILHVYLFIYFVYYECGWAHIQHSMEVRGQPEEILGVELRLAGLAGEAVITDSTTTYSSKSTVCSAGVHKNFFNKYLLLTLPSISTHPHPTPASPLYFSGQFSSTLVSLCHIYIHDTIYTYIYMCVYNLESTNERKCIYVTESNLMCLI